MFFRRKSWLASYATDHHLIKRPKALWPKILIGIGIILAVILLLLAPAFINGFAIYQKVKSLDTSAGLILNSASKQDLSAIAGNLAGVENDLLDIKSKAKNLGPILLLPPIAKTARTGDQMISATVNLLEGYREILSVFTALNLNSQEGQLAINFSTPAGRQAVLKAIVDNQGLLENARVKINNAKAQLASINASDMNGIFKDKVVYANSVLSEIVGQSDTALPLFKYLPDLAGYGQQKNYLVLFQNNMELRPTGGFIGSYGLITVRDGEIISISTDDIYNLDKYSKDKLFVPAPWPMTTYNVQKYLFLRDANWSPDWPTDAKQIDWFWNTERANAGLPPVHLDGVMAITPDAIANFLALTGPITADGVTFNHDNFSLALEKAVEFDYQQRGQTLATRKSIIGDLSKEMMSRLLSSSPKDLLKVWMVAKQDIEEKNIITWLADPAMQNYFSQENWTGEVKSAEDDYLYVVDANLASLKTDSVMKRSIDYSVSIDKNGDLIGRTAITYQHTGKSVPGLISTYGTYTRIYVPAGTWFTRAYLQDNRGTFDLGLTKEASIGDELGKTYLGAFLTVAPGASRTFVIEYRLPQKIKTDYKNGLYKLSVQKQPGTAGHKLKIDLKFDQPITAYNADNLPAKLTGKELQFTSDLRIDRDFTVKF